VYLEHLLSEVVAVLHHHQHPFLFYHLLYHCVDDLLHLVGLVHGFDESPFEVDRQEEVTQLLLR
jgi:hypothetical protein